MEKSIKIILFVIIALILVNFLSNLFGNSNLRGIKQNLEKARRTADSALNELAFSRSKLDSIKADMLVFRAYINNIQNRVELADTEKKLREEKDNKRKDELRKAIDSLKKDIDTDSLPDIDVVSVKKTN